jgi:hypothetical protein
MLCTRHSMGQVDRLTELVYELLDAHEDTARLAQEMPGDPCWEAHLEYLRRLQRVGREALAHIAQQPVK